MKRALALGYATVAYVAFFAAFSYMVGFLANTGVANSVDAGGPVAATRGAAIAINLLLVSVFGLQHSIMARPGFKRVWTRVVPEPIERSTYVLASNLALVLILWQWRPIPEVIWHTDSAPLRLAMWTLLGVGVVIIVASSFLIDHFDLFGLRQVYDYARNQKSGDDSFRTPMLYKLVRHPMMVGVVIAVWATPTMTVGHLIFAAAMTAYVIIGVQFEERDLTRVIGAEYEAYKQRVPQLLPRPWRR